MRLADGVLRSVQVSVRVRLFVAGAPAEAVAAARQDAEWRYWVAPFT